MRKELFCYQKIIDNPCTVVDSRLAEDAEIEFEYFDK